MVKQIILQHLRMLLFVMVKYTATFKDVTTCYGEVMGWGI